MESIDLNRVKQIFGEALAREGAGRAAYLDEACAGDAQLRAEVEAYLAAAALSGEPDSSKADTRDTSAGPVIPLAEGPSTVVGRYRILEQIGEGGFGVVFMAEQERPVRRRVALKIIKLGMDTKQVVARFEAERQALAMMDHPNIAKVLDGGATDSGRPYFVMELVRGTSITEYCDRARLGVRARLELLSQVCQAVQHAHQKGLIHRDLKPSNVLVSIQDDRPVVRVIDFGIAKATQARLTEKTLFTEFRQLIGTPEYMSPEQAGSDLDIDTRSDVYSLGVLMYELLTGSPPFAAKDLRSKAYAEMQRIIREVDPPSPSARLSTLEVLPAVAAHRQLEPRRLCQTVQGELDWIVMKCLEKDRTRRYESAAAVAADIAHHLADEPVTVGAPSTAYRVRKFVRRNKGPVAAAAVILAALVIGIIGTTIGLISESRRRVTAERERAAAQYNLAMAFQSNHRFTEAEELYRKSLRSSSASTELDERQRSARTMMSLAYNLWTQQRLVEAERTYLEALSAVRQAYPPGDAYVAQPLRMIAQLYRGGFRDWTRAEPYSREALAISRQLSPVDHPALAADTFGEGDALSNTGRYSEAVPFLRESMAEHRLIADTAGYGYAAWELGLVLIAQGRMQEAEAAFLEARNGVKGKDGFAESASILILYTIWDRAEPGKGYDAKAKQWHDMLMNDSPHFRAALAALERPATRPSVTGSGSQ